MNLWGVFFQREAIFSFPLFRITNRFPIVFSAWEKGRRAWFKIKKIPSKNEKKLFELRKSCCKKRKLTNFFSENFFSQVKKNLFSFNHSKKLRNLCLRNLWIFKRFYLFFPFEKIWEKKPLNFFEKMKRRNIEKIFGDIFSSEDAQSHCLKHHFIKTISKKHANRKLLM